MLQVAWSAEALDDLETIANYISLRNPAAADRIKLLVEHTAEHLGSQPYIHRPGRVSGTREAVVHPNYILIYRVGSDLVDILAVLHARQNYP